MAELKKLREELVKGVDATQHVLFFMGVRLRIHYTWLIVIVFMTAAVSTQFSTAISLPRRIMLGLIASVLYFCILLVREFFVALVAHRHGASARTVTVFAIGAVRDINPEKLFPGLESLIAVSGMLVTLVIAGILFLTYQALAQSGNDMVHTLVQWLAFVSFMLALLNAAPGLPMDGGRLVRSILWGAKRDYRRVTLALGWVGWAGGMLMIVAGVYLGLTTRQVFVAMLLALPGLVYQNASTHIRRLVAE